MPDLKPDHLIVRYLSNEATPAEQEKLFDWVLRSKENQPIFNEYVNLWSNTDKTNNSFNFDQALGKLNDRIDEFEVAEKKKTVFWNRWNLAAKPWTTRSILGFTILKKSPKHLLIH